MSTRKTLKYGLIFSVLVVVMPIFLFITSAIEYRSLPSEFCTLEDEVYQTIKREWADWLKYFKSQSYDEYPLLQISVASGARYSVNAERWNILSEQPEFFIIIRDEPWEPFGYAGYLFKNKSMLDHRYHIEELGEDIFCYRFK